MKKKMVCILMAGIMASLVPAQMVFAEGESGEKTVVKFQTWNPGTEEYVGEMIDKFEEEHPDIEVQHIYMPYTDHVEKLKVDLSAGDAADVFGVQTGAMYKEFRDFEEDLTPYLVKEYGDDWASNYNEYAMSLLKGDDGEYYAVPLGLSYAGYVWANMKYFDKYDLELPTNYDELKAVCQTFRDNGEYPLVIGAKDSWINIDTWMNIAADINTEKLYSAIEGETPFTDEDLVQSFQIWQNCFTDGVFQDGALGVGMYTDSTDMYQKEGSVPMILNGSWSLGAYMDSDEQSQEVYNGEGANHKIFLMDWNNDGKIAPVEEAVDVSLAINNQSKVKDAAWTFVDWMLHEGADFLINGHLQYMPARNDMELNVEGLNENGAENLEYCVEQGKDNVGGYREMAYAELKETIINELTELALGDVTPEEAAETIEAASQAQER
ncbi:MULTISPECIES: ABC transporter substrate-binding protein [unclassified Ruminococcus]|uniref:ABC transporter substrate-binding protein n=1 Tax=unclassified Ruminococcus TaxID=2608920 RepID=UPI00319DB5A9